MFSISASFFTLNSGFAGSHLHIQNLCDERVFYDDCFRILFLRAVDGDGRH